MDEPCGRLGLCKVSNDNISDAIGMLASSAIGTALVMSGRPPTAAAAGSVVHPDGLHQQHVAGSIAGGDVPAGGEDAAAEIGVEAAAPAASLRASGFARAAKRPVAQLSDDSSWDDDDDVRAAEPKRHRGVAAAVSYALSDSDSDATYANGNSPARGRRKQQPAAASKAKKKSAAKKSGPTPRKSGAGTKKSGGATKAPAASKRGKKCSAAAAAAPAGGAAEPAEPVQVQVAVHAAAAESEAKAAPPAAAVAAPAAAVVVEEEQEQEAPAPSIKKAKQAAAPTRAPLAQANQLGSAALLAPKPARRPGGNMRNKPIQPQVKARVAGLRRKK